MVSKRLLMIMVAGVDLFAAMLIAQLQPAAGDWDAWMAISDPQQAAAVRAAEPVQIWVRPGTIGFWPNLTQPLSEEELCRQVAARAKADPRRLELRLLCDPQLSVEELGRLSVRLAPHAESLAVGPLQAAP